MKQCLLKLSFSLALSSCVYPVQSFKPGSALDIKANPPLTQNLTEGHRVLVAVIDSGVDYNHPELRPHLRANRTQGGLGLDLLGRDSFPFPVILDPQSGEEIEDLFAQNPHGTHVASLALLGARLRDHRGNRFDAAPLLGLIPVRALPLDDEGLAGDSREEVERHTADRLVDYLLRAMEFAAAEGAHVANFSLGVDAKGMKDDFAKDILRKRMVTELLPRALEEWRHILFVFAAGNESMEVNSDLFPASFKGENLLTVGALARGKEIAEYSNHGPLVDVFVRGSDVNGLVPGGRRERMSGTSMATPLVSNLAAKSLLLAPCLKASELRSLIVESADSMDLKIEGKETKLMVKVVNFRRTLEDARKLGARCP